MSQIKRWGHDVARHAYLVQISDSATVLLNLTKSKRVVFMKMKPGTAETALLLRIDVMKPDFSSQLNLEAA